jgi:hypothetical protein
MYFHDLPLFVKNTILLHGVLVLYNILFYDFKQLLLIKQWQQAKLPVVQDTCHPTTNPNLKGNVMSRKVMMCTIALTAVVNVINSPRPPNNWPNTSAVRTYVPLWRGDTRMVAVEKLRAPTFTEPNDPEDNENQD